ncbi:MAG: hypothetical protein ACQEXJ_22110 [Myxococcota bacterium]
MRRTTLLPLAWLAAITLALAPSGCDDDTSGGGPGEADGVEVAGTWDTDYDTTLAITADAWGEQVLAGYDNAINVAVTQNPADAEFDPEKFNRLVWTEPAADGAFWYCTVDFGLDTEQAAWDSEATADDSDPANGGCGGFPWTEMTPAE